MFINQLINFIIVAIAIFILIKAINTAKKRFEREKEAAPPPPPTLDQQLLMDIRDTLKARKA
jgi:large conductance mechanosensitive channel